MFVSASCCCLMALHCTRSMISARPPSLSLRTRAMSHSFDYFCATELRPIAGRTVGSWLTGSLRLQDSIPAKLIDCSTACVSVLLRRLCIKERGVGRAKRNPLLAAGGAEDGFRFAQ